MLPKALSKLEKFASENGTAEGWLYGKKVSMPLLYVVKNACVFYRLAESVDSTVGRFNLHGIVLWECVRLFLAFCTSVNKWMYYLLWLVCRVSHLCMNIARFCVSHDHQCTRCTRPTNWHSYVVAKSSCLLYAFELQNCREKPKKTLHNIMQWAFSLTCTILKAVICILSTSAGHICWLYHIPSLNWSVTARLTKCLWWLSNVG